MNDKLNKLKEVIQQANPEIMELKFGCEVMVNDRKYTLLDKEGKDNKGNWYGRIESFSLNKPDNFHYENLRVISIRKILGRPIRLADVLFTLNANLLFRDEIFETPLDFELWVFNKWNLKDDNLEHQNQETIDFLTKLLCKE